MSWRNIKLIFLREVRDQFRDRRTLFMMAVLPLLLYPALAIGMLQMTLLFSEQPRTVVILGADELPDQPALLEGEQFNSSWFSLPDDASKLRVVTDLPQYHESEEQEEDVAVSREALLEQARQIREALKTRDELTQKLQEVGNPQQAGQLLQEQEEINARLSQLFNNSQMEVLILVPEGFKENVRKANDLFRDADKAEQPIGDYPGVQTVRNRADEKSQMAYMRVKEAVDLWEKEILRQRLQQAGLHEKFATPVNSQSVDVAREEQLSANVWSKMFPTLIVIMAVTGAFYPAIDLGAGEKERGTMETLLISPARRTEIVMGKFFTVMLFSVSTALLNLASIAFTGKYMASIAGPGALQGVGDLSLPGPLAFVWVGVLLMPLAALFSALCLSLATFARSNKEGQYYLTPLLMITLGLTVFCLSPGVEIQPFYSIMPIVGPTLLLKELVAAPLNTDNLLYAIPVLITSIIYSLLALWWAIEQFNREDILFREAERFELKLWIQHLLRDKEPLPSFTEAGFCFVMIMFLQFGAMKFLSSHIMQTPKGAEAITMIRLLIMQQLVIIACPALFMGLILTTRPLRTFRLQRPKWSMLLVAGLLPFALHPIAVGLQDALKWFFPSLPPGVVQQLATMTDESTPIWLVLLGFAVAPAICEEFAFRGFILSGFNSNNRTWLAIGLSSVAFGAMHMIPQQVFNATLLGIVLGLIAIRGGSLWPCILFHFVNNALGVGHAKLGEVMPKEGPATWFVRIQSGQALYTWPTLLVAAVVAFFLIRWVATYGQEKPEPADDFDEFPSNPELAPSRLPLGS